MNAYGIDVDEQNKIINNMNEFIMEIRVGQRNSLLQFQKGILLSNQSLQAMFVYLQNQYSSETCNIQYVLTRRLNQDILENFFSYIRSMGSGYDHPTPVEVKNRLKWYILGKHSEHVLSERRNTENDSCDSLTTETDQNDLNAIYLTDRISQEEKDILMFNPQAEQTVDNIRKEAINEHCATEEAVEGMRNN